MFFTWIILAMQIAVGTLNTGTGAAGTTVDSPTLTDQNGQPLYPQSGNTIVLFKWAGRTATGQAEGDHKFGMGYAVGTADRGGSTSQSDHSPTTMACDGHVFNDACIKLLTIAGAVDGAADIASDFFQTQSFRLTIDDAFSASYLIEYMVIKDPALQAASDSVTLTGTGNFDITSLSFQPDTALVFGGGVAAINTTDTWSNFCFGAATGGTPTNYVLAGASDDGEPTAVTMSYCRGGECLACVGPDIVTHRGSITSFLSNGARVNCSEHDGIANPTFRVLCLRGVKVAVGDFLTATNTTPFTETGLGFAPVGAILTSHNKAQSTSDTTQAGDERSVGFVTAAAQNYSSIIDKDAAGTADIGVAQNTDNCYANQSTAATIVIEGTMSCTSMNRDGFTFTMTDADPSQAFVWYLAFGQRTLPVFHRSQRFFRRRAG